MNPGTKRYLLLILWTAGLWTIMELAYTIYEVYWKYVERTIDLSGAYPWIPILVGLTFGAYISLIFIKKWRLSFNLPMLLCVTLPSLVMNPVFTLPLGTPPLFSPRIFVAPGVGFDSCVVLGVVTAISLILGVVGPEKQAPKQRALGPGMTKEVNVSGGADLSHSKGMFLSNDNAELMDTLMQRVASQQHSFEVLIPSGGFCMTHPVVQSFTNQMDMVSWDIQEANPNEHPTRLQIREKPVTKQAPLDYFESEIVINGVSIFKNRLDDTSVQYRFAVKNTQIELIIHGNYGIMLDEFVESLVPLRHADMNAHQ